MSQPEPVTAPPARPGRFARFWRSTTLRERIVVVASGVATVLGLVGLIVPLAIALGDRGTSTQTVAVDVEFGSTGGQGLASPIEPVAAGIGPTALGGRVDDSYLAGDEDWAVPVDAPWAELWALMIPGECGVMAQIEWLDRHGRVIPPKTFSARITNTAISGGDLVISEIRPQGRLSQPTGDTVTVSYTPMCVGGGDDGIYAHITLGVDPVAIFDECYQASDACYTSPDANPMPGDPVVFAVRPGETRALTLTYDQVVDFEGRFVATVTVDGQESTIDISPDGRDVVAPHVTHSELYLSIGPSVDNTYCTAQRSADPWGGRGCTLDAWLAILASR